MKIVKKIIEKQKNPALAPGVTVAFLGDSVTQGCFELYKTGEKSFLPEFRIEDAYHTKFRQILELLYPSVPVNMIHAGISGATAPEALERVERDVCAFCPDLTVVCFGLNDCCEGFDGIDTYKKALEGIFEKLEQTNTEIIFMTPNLMADTISYEVTDDYLKGCFEWMIEHSQNSLGKYMEAAKDICRQRNIKVCDCYHVWEMLKSNDVDTTRLLANRINHPVEKMHWLFAIKLIEAIFEQ